jgi:hypothetical protein
LREAFPVQMTYQKQLEKVEYFNYLGSITNYARCTHGIKSRIPMAKGAFNKKKTLFHQQIGLRLEEEANKVLHMKHSFILC